MRHLIIAFGFLITLSGASSAEISLPPEADGLRLGMSKESLLERRPSIKRKGWMGEPVDLSKSELILFEDIKLPSSIFSGLIYGIENNQLKSITLSGYPKLGEERATRRKAIKDARLRWGPAHKKRAPEDPVRKGKGIAAFIWEIENHEILLQLPTTRGSGDSKAAPVSLIIRPISPKNKPLADINLSPEEKGLLLKNNDADDMEIQK